MNNETQYLQTIAEEIAARALDRQEEIVKADHHLVMEAGRLEKVITNCLGSIENFTQRDTYHFNTLTRLVNICDLLYDITGSVNANVTVLIELLTAVKRVIPNELRPNLKLPKAFVEIRGAAFAESWLHHSSLMAKYDVPEKLIAIAGIPFKRFTEPKENLLWGDFTWLKGYEAKLEILDWENADCNSPAEALLSLLIGRDFNDDRFFIYCKNYVKERTKHVAGKRNRLLAYAECEKLVQEDTQVGIPSFDGRANSVSTRLIKWIREEIDFVETHERELAFAKLDFRFYKYTVAFFFKLLHEQKVFGDISFRELSDQVASTCSAMGADIPPASIVKKAYPKKQVDFKQMETLWWACLNI